MKYTNILFDLDGTLTDPYLGITSAAKYALNKFNIIEEDTDKLKLFIGPPLEKSFLEYYNFNKNDVKTAVKYYREYYSKKGMYENKLYAGIDDVLKELNKRNKNCFMATSKLQSFAEKIAQNFNMHNYFKHITGSNMDGTLSEKEDIVKYTMEKCELNKNETIMIGDRKYDIIGANKNGIDAIGVLYGYGTREELEKENPKYLCNEVIDILKIII
jgi:phosphoglycolate phosphatase